VLIISTLSFLYTMLQFMYYTFIDISFSHSFYFYFFITCRLFESWQEGATLLLLLLFLPPPGEAENLSTMRISMTISAQYQIITMIVKMTIQHLTTSLFSDHPRKQWAGSHPRIPSRQDLENMSLQLNSLLHQCDPYILSIGWSIFSRRRRMNASLRLHHPGRYSIKGLNDSIRPIKSIFTRGRIQTKTVSNWFHGMLGISGNMGPL